MYVCFCLKLHKTFVTTKLHFETTIEFNHSWSNILHLESLQDPRAEILLDSSSKHSHLKNIMKLKLTKHQMR